MKLTLEDIAILENFIQEYLDAPNLQEFAASKKFKSPSQAWGTFSFLRKIGMKIPKRLASAGVFASAEWVEFKKWRAEQKAKTETTLLRPADNGKLREVA